jgi:hypothetical protein
MTTPADPLAGLVLGTSALVSRATGPDQIAPSLVRGLAGHPRGSADLPPGGSGCSGDGDRVVETALPLAHLVHGSRDGLHSSPAAGVRLHVETPHLSRRPSPMATAVNRRILA